MSKAYESAVRLLARREHSARELADKLTHKECSFEEAQEAIERCQTLGLQSDERFVDSFMRLRICQGYGPLKISQDLKQKGISSELMQSALSKEQPNWLGYAVEVWQKKYKNQPALSFKELQKQQRFLLYRGFDMAIVMALVKELEICVK